MATEDTATDQTADDADDVDAGDADQQIDADGTDSGKDSEDGADQLGDKGKQALDRMKGERNAARAEAREFKTFVKELGYSTLAELKAALEKDDGGDGEDRPDPAAIRKQAREEAAAEVLRERALDKAVVKAAGKLADPEDARLFLADRVEDFVADGKIDQDEIAEAIDDLLKSKPHLAAQGGRRFQGGADGGARKGSRPAQVTEQELKRMSPQEIVKARQEGRLKDLL